MRIDGPKGLGAWLNGYFSGSFRGNLQGTASYAETASYVSASDVKGLGDYLNRVKGGVVEGQVILSGSTTYSDRMVVHGAIKVLGSITEGLDTVVSGEGAHAEGKETKAKAAGSHAEGVRTRALGVGSHAEGKETKAIGIGSHAEGLGTIAAGDHQTVVGRYNIPEENNKYLFIVGNGTSDAKRSNAFAVRVDGGLEFGDPGNTLNLSGSTVGATAFIVREKVYDTIIDRVQLEYNHDRESLDFRFLDEEVI